MTVEQLPWHQGGVEAKGGCCVAEPQPDLGRVRLAERLQPADYDVDDYC